MYLIELNLILFENYVPKHKFINDTFRIFRYMGIDPRYRSLFP